MSQKPCYKHIYTNRNLDKLASEFALDVAKLLHTVVLESQNLSLSLFKIVGLQLHFNPLHSQH